MTVTDIMRDHVLTAAPDDLVDDIAADLCDVNVGCAVVVEGDRPVGIVTDRDIAVRCDANWVDTRGMTVGEVMSTDLVTVELDTSVFDVTRRMADEGVRRIPVIDDGDLVGIVTQDDLIVLLSRELQHLAGTVETESPPEQWGRAY